MRRLVLAAIAAELLFLLLMTVADIAAGWPVRETISELVYHDTAALARASFAIHALSLVLVALLVHGRSRQALFVASVGMVFVTGFDTDPPGVSTVDGRVHLLGAVLAFAGVAVAAFFERRRWPVLSWLVVGNTVAMVGAGFVGGLTLGLLERFQAYLNGAFLVTLALATDFSSTSESPEP